LEVLREFIARREYPPTMKELGALLEVTAASAHQQIKQLERKGYVSRQPRQARSLAVVREPRQEVDTLTERLETRKVVERAKGRLMTAYGMTEPQAFKWIQRTAMDHRMGMREVAERILAETADKAE